MHSGLIEQTWRGTLITGLQEHYGLSENEAQTKVDTWFQLVAEDGGEFETPTERRKQRRLVRPRSSGIQLTVRRRRSS